MQKITPFLTFDGKAEEAAEFYITLLPDSRIDRITRSPMDTPGGATGSVLVVEFTLAGMSYVALNTPGFTFTEAVSFMIQTENQAETDRLWEALTSNGGEAVACGWLKDKYGLFWQITPARMLELLRDPDRARAHRAMKAMTEMVKIDIAKIECAADQA